MTSSAPRVALLDYGSGNLRSAHRALERVGARVELTSDHRDLWIRPLDQLSKLRTRSLLPKLSRELVASSARDLGLGEQDVERRCLPRLDTHERGRAYPLGNLPCLRRDRDAFSLDDRAIRPPTNFLLSEPTLTAPMEPVSSSAVTLARKPEVNSRMLATSGEQTTKLAPPRRVLR